MRIVPLARKVRDLTRGRDVRAKQGKDAMRWVAVALVFVITVVLTTPAAWVGTMRSIENNTIREPIIAQFAFEFQPSADSRAWQERRDIQYTRIYEYDSSVRADAEDRVSAIISAALQVGSNADITRIREQLQSVEPQLEVWSDAELVALAKLARDERFRDAVPLILNEIYSGAYITDPVTWTKYKAIEQYTRIESTGLPPDRNSQVRLYDEDTNIAIRHLIKRHLSDAIRDSIPNSERDEDVLVTSGGKAAFQLLQLVVKPNFRYDDQGSLASYAAYPKEPPLIINKGAMLAPWRDGADATVLAAERNQQWPRELTEFEAELIETYSGKLVRATVMKFGAQVLFVFITFLIISFFVMKFSRELVFNTQTVLLLSLPVLLALGLGRVFLSIAGDATSYAGFAFPAGVIGILGVLLLDVRLAILLVTWGCVLFGLEANLRYEFVIVGLLGGYTGVAALYTFRERREVLYAGLFIGFVNCSSILILDFISGQTEHAWTAAAIGALGGVFCSLISFAVLPVFEVAFHITTDMRLLELSGLQHPLLREMEDKAPGTLQHTLNVAKLAESAATAIGVSYLLVRAGVYFHDIGKISKPEYFTENQLTPEDKRRHESLTPNMSTLIIKNHVKEGQDLARKYKLPKIVADFIPEHHGTSLIQYFYTKALQAHQRGEIREPIREEDFRYPGPRPQSIESAIVMLADTVEATATAKLSGRVVREDDIQLLVRQAINEKFNDGQFDDCNLTLRDLNIIRESFVKTLRSRFHARIDYPTMRRPGDGGTTTRRDDLSSDRLLVDTRDSRASREVATGA